MATLRAPFDPAPNTTVLRTSLTAGRYPGQQITYLAAQPNGLVWPATAEAVGVPADAVTAGIDHLLELQPLPFGLEAVLRALGPGAPTFYVGYSGAPAPDDHDLVEGGAPIPGITRAVFGVVFQHHVVLEPWAWLELLAEALATAGDAAAAAAYRALAAPLPRTLRVLDAQGRPAAGERFTMRKVDSNGNVVTDATLTSDAEGDLGTAAFPAASQTTTLRWQPPGGDTLPLVAYYEGTSRALPDEAGLTLPAGFRGGHLQILDLAAWLADPPPHARNKPWPQRFHAGSHLQPLVDGIPMFRELVPDLRASRFAVPGAGGTIERGGTHMLGGWAFNDFELIPGDESSKLSELVKFIRSGDPNTAGDARLLAAQFVQPTPGVFSNMTDTGTLVMMGLLGAAVMAGAITDELDLTSTAALLGLEAAIAIFVVIVMAEVLTAADVEQLIRKHAEGTKPDFIDKLNEDGVVALYAPHPVTLADNPVGTDIDVGVGRLSDFTTHLGLFHDKMQLVRRQPDGDARPDAGDGFHYAAYVGGIDINGNRVDTPGHQGKRNYHDVHARVTGPVAKDLFGFFDDRYGLVAGAPPKVFDPPGAIPPAGEHIVQAARTAFRPAPGRTGLPWAPTGDATIRETIGRAIQRARQYIYVEDQYFTPDDSYVQLLRDAAGHCERLVIVHPTESDQPVGDDRRGAVVHRLLEPGGWDGDRIYVGAPVRRPALLVTSHSSSLGRCYLVEAVPDATAAEIIVGPITRVPKPPPYFVWVGGELMAVEVAEPVTAPSGGPAMKLKVIRGALGTQPRWCDHPRAHAAGEPVTVARQRGIFVHSKTMIVDDIFVGIGSCNVDRRGYFHDGEINVFAIPERLRGAADNPALDLRTRLWAEHLGLPPAMGPALLADPLAAFELFGRTRYAGNRLARFRELSVPFAGLPAVAEVLTAELKPVAEIVKNALFLALEANRTEIWNTATDPTTATDPAPREGPTLP